MVFCTLCTSSTHGGGVSEHTVIPFSIAIKRMSEILLFKARQCMENLNKAYDNMNEETRKLDLNTERACDSVNAAFTEFQQMLEKRRAEVLQVDELRYHMTAELCQFIGIEVGFSLHIG